MRGAKLGGVVEERRHRLALVGDDRAKWLARRLSVPDGLADGRSQLAVAERAREGIAGAGDLEAPGLPGRERDDDGDRRC